MKTNKVFKKISEPVKLLKLDFGCGPNPAEGFDGVDIIAFNDKIKYIHDLRDFPLPFENESVEEARASHFIEHLTAEGRVMFMNELYRILIPGGKFLMITPHWASNRAYGDPTHQWPPISEMWFYYLNQDWRKKETPHCDIEFNPQGYNCNFQANWGYSLRQDLAVRNQEYQQNAIMNYKEACQDIIATLVKL